MTKSNAIRRYLADHPQAKAAEVAAACDCSLVLVRQVRSVERYKAFQAAKADRP